MLDPCFTDQGSYVAAIDPHARFAIKASERKLRSDRRLFQQLRSVEIEFPLEQRGVCTIRLGQSVVAASVQAELIEPAPFSPKKGIFEIYVQGSGAFYKTKGAGISGLEDITEIQRILESTIKASRAVDLESLCIIPGKYVWGISLNVSIISDDGNITDASVWAASAALRHARRCEVSIHNDKVVVHPSHERDPIPITLSSLPLSVSAAVVTGGGDLVLDPSTAELVAAETRITVIFNNELQTCGVLKQGKTLIEYSLIEKCIKDAKSIFPQVARLIKTAIEKDEQEREAKARERFEWAQKRIGVASR